MTFPSKIHSFGDDALGMYDASELSALINERKVSPEELIDAAINRAQKVNALNAITFECFFRAKEQALTPPTTGFFKGIPFFIKDNTDIKGLPSRQGSLAIKAFPAPKDHAVTTQMLAQGFIPLGKSRLPEFGFNASTEFVSEEPTRNPWNIDYSSGASSGGAAALVASGVVPIAHANDGGGSIRIPAACCGLVGLKPSRGRLAAADMAKFLPINLVSDGVVSRSVRDTANFFAEAERYAKAKNLKEVGHVQFANTRRLKIALMSSTVTGASIDHDTLAALNATAKLLEGLGHHIIPLNIDNLPISKQFADDFSAYWGMLSFMVAKVGPLAMRGNFDAKQLDPLSVGLAALFKKNAFKLPMILHRLKKSEAQYQTFFKNYDILLSPVLAHSTPELGYLSPANGFDTLFERLRNYVCFTPLNNIAGGPAISLPLGMSNNGLPIGMHFSANMGNERTLLELAFELEAAQPFKRIYE